ncbi:MarR family winged helix-turn-helix transcriptional regulator [Crossiella sp. NPDC003009]
MVDLKSLYHDLIHYEMELWDAVDRRLRAECDLQVTWFEVMRVIARHPGCRVQDIAADLGITVGGVSKVVDRVEAARHCKRRANPDDRRSSIVELTAAGSRLLAKATGVFEAELEVRLGSVVPERSLKQFSVTLGKLRAAGRAMGEGHKPA